MGDSSPSGKEVLQMRSPPRRTVCPAWSLKSSYAISYGQRCLVCSLFFRKMLVDWGEDPDHPGLSDEEGLLTEFGTAISRDPHRIADEIYARLSARYTEEQKVLLVGFAGIMVATNLFKTVARVPPDGVLAPYQTDAIREFAHVE